MSTPFDRRPALDYLFASPLTAFLYPLHHLLLRLRGPPRLPPPNARAIRVVCISDTHTLEWSDVPDGDLLIHAGDLSNDGSIREIQAAVDWLQKLPHPHKVVICGNHDSYFDVRSRRDEDRDLSSSSSSAASIRSIDDLDGLHRINWGTIHYLQHSSVTLSFPPAPSSSSSTTTSTTTTRPRSLTLYGAPQIPAIVPLGPEHAFTYPSHHDAWSGTVPPETDILITHTPPQSHLDLSPVYSTGCPFLLAETWRVRPALHVFGHVHENSGREAVYWDEAQRAWERLCAARRPRARLPGFSALLGLLRDLWDVRGWADSARVLLYGVMGVVWARVWGGENRGCGWMVNAACMKGNTGRLGNKPQVVVL
ncbi:metallophosphatase domain-containing protein [Aspergillus clavatus NRRL 1]|uniref:Phosphoric ester hydrolase, putative n=1 Tax=Aspergillus clavatus (strain ATCC 1007 / CBS 513.65 / DSM 816 / NCTC 3887 / NRRL 1 / QM 1276 / 107) TaxID=344612 RepID=A1C9H7_ASPCL|nr:phosphoric ester hydrolase, putative [Aspergillus clavatus NRRL 1]EAW13501.1 phosphoric ester hydrolase, putative [Aspergillus clavatus NRRL 1]